MIDIENEVFDTLKKAIVAIEPTATVVGDYVDSEVSYPAVTILELDNRVEDMMTGGVETHASVSYEVNVYTNDLTGRKARNKKISAIVAQTFETLGFERVSLSQIPNFNNPSVFRTVGRYRAIVDTNNVTYRR